MIITLPHPGTPKINCRYFVVPTSVGCIELSWCAKTHQITRLNIRNSTVTSTHSHLYQIVKYDYSRFPLQCKRSRRNNQNKCMVPSVSMWKPNYGLPAPSLGRKTKLVLMPSFRASTISGSSVAGSLHRLFDVRWTLLEVSSLINIKYAQKNISDCSFFFYFG